MPASVAASIAALDRLAEEMTPHDALLSRLRSDGDHDLAVLVFGLDQPMRQLRLRAALARAWRVAWYYGDKLEDRTAAGRLAADEGRLALQKLDEVELHLLRAFRALEKWRDGERAASLGGSYIAALEGMREAARASIEWGAPTASATAAPDCNDADEEAAEDEDESDDVDCPKGVPEEMMYRLPSSSKEDKLWRDHIRKWAQRDPLGIEGALSVTPLGREAQKPHWWLNGKPPRPLNEEAPRDWSLQARATKWLSQDERSWKVAEHIETEEFPNKDHGPDRLLLLRLGEIYSFNFGKPATWYRNQGAGADAAAVHFANFLDAALGCCNWPKDDHPEQVEGDAPPRSPVARVPFAGQELRTRRADDHLVTDDKLRGVGRAFPPGWARERMGWLAGDDPEYRERQAGRPDVGYSTLLSPRLLWEAEAKEETVSAPSLK